MSLNQRTDRIAGLVAATFTLASFMLVLVLPSDTLLSASNTDMVSEFVSSRAYLAISFARCRWRPAIIICKLFTHQRRFPSASAWTLWIGLLIWDWRRQNRSKILT
jgi:hypothetical protein